MDEAKLKEAKKKLEKFLKLTKGLKSKAEDLKFEMLVDTIKFHEEKTKKAVKDAGVKIEDDKQDKEKEDKLKEAQDLFDEAENLMSTDPDGAKQKAAEALEILRRAPLGEEPAEEEEKDTLKKKIEEMLGKRTEEEEKTKSEETEKTNKPKGLLDEAEQALSNNDPDTAQKQAEEAKNFTGDIPDAAEKTRQENLADEIIDKAKAKRLDMLLDEADTAFNSSLHRKAIKVATDVKSRLAEISEDTRKKPVADRADELLDRYWSFMIEHEISEAEAETDHDRAKDMLSNADTDLSNITDTTERTRLKNRIDHLNDILDGKVSKAKAESIFQLIQEATAILEQDAEKAIDYAEAARKKLGDISEPDNKKKAETKIDEIIEHATIVLIRADIENVKRYHNTDTGRDLIPKIKTEIDNIKSDRMKDRLKMELENFTSELTEEAIDPILQDAERKKDAGDFEEAINLIRQAGDKARSMNIMTSKTESNIRSTRDKYYSQWIENDTGRAESLDFKEAEKIIEDAEKRISSIRDNTVQTEAKDKLEQTNRKIIIKEVQRLIGLADEKLKTPKPTEDDFKEALTLHRDALVASAKFNDLHDQVQERINMITDRMTIPIQVNKEVDTLLADSIFFSKDNIDAGIALVTNTGKTIKTMEKKSSKLQKKIADTKEKLTKILDDSKDDEDKIEEVKGKLKTRLSEVSSAITDNPSGIGRDWWNTGFEKKELPLKGTAPEDIEKTRQAYFHRKLYDILKVEFEDYIDEYE